GCAGSISSGYMNCATATSWKRRAGSTCTGARCNASSPSAPRADPTRLFSLKLKRLTPGSLFPAGAHALAHPRPNRSGIDAKRSRTGPGIGVRPREQQGRLAAAARDAHLTHPPGIGPGDLEPTPLEAADDLAAHRHPAQDGDNQPTKGIDLL